MDAVEHGPTQIPVTAKATDLARAVEWQCWQQHIESKFFVEVTRIERTEVFERLPHLITVNPDKPWTRLARVSQHARTRDLVWRVGEPAIATGFIVPRFVFAFELKAFKREPSAACHHARLADLGHFERQRGAVIFFGLFEPAPRFEQRRSFGDFARNFCGLALLGQRHHE